MSRTVEVINAFAVVQVDYTNWRGERAVRTIQLPGRIFYGSNEWHPEPQWLIEALDVDKQAMRTFSFRGLGWPELPPPALKCHQCGKEIPDDEYVVNWGSCDPCFDEHVDNYYHELHLKHQGKIDWDNQDPAPLLGITL